jgi:hypothetical protein
MERHGHCQTPLSPVPIPGLTVSGAAGAKAISLQQGVEPVVLDPLPLLSQSWGWTA